MSCTMSSGKGSISTVGLVCLRTWNSIPIVLTTMNGVWSFRPRAPDHAWRTSASTTICSTTTGDRESISARGVSMGRGRDIYIYNNTVFHNGSVKHWAGGTGGVDVRGQDLRRVFIVNNIVFDNAAYEIATFASPETARRNSERQTDRHRQQSDGSIPRPVERGRGVQSAVRLSRRADARGGSHVREREDR